MCIIVDACVVHEINNGTKHGRPVLNWLLGSSRSGLVVGGKLKGETFTGKFQRIAVELSRAGRLHVYPDHLINPVENDLRANGECRSNDAHVLALAMVSKCNLVFTDDRALQKDIKARPSLRIAIYRYASHRHLLAACRCNAPPAA
jgi:hypothetical protein